MEKICRKILSLVIVLLLAMSIGGCQGQKEQSSTKTADYKANPEAVTLTVVCKDKKKTFTEEDLAALGVESRDYSGRSKKVVNARQFFTYEGVDLKVILESCGIKTEKALIKVVCSDGYTREYALKDIYGLYTYSSNENDEKRQVDPMIAIIKDDPESKYPCPFKLVYGQGDYDKESSQDYNMQGWASYLQYIEVSYE